MNIDKLNIDKLICIIGTICFLTCGCYQKQHEQVVKSDEFKIGDPIPRISLKDLRGNLIDLNAELKSGPVLLNLWATWCQPCIEEMDELIALHKAQLGNPTLRVISINMDAPSAKSEVEKFVKDKGIIFPVLMDPDWTTIEQLNIQGYPETFLIGSEGSFLSIKDPESGVNSIRILSKRKWADPKMKVALCEAIKTCYG